MSYTQSILFISIIKIVNYPVNSNILGKDSKIFLYCFKIIILNCDNAIKKYPSICNGTSFSRHTKVVIGDISIKYNLSYLPRRFYH